MAFSKRDYRSVSINLLMSWNFIISFD